LNVLDFEQEIDGDLVKTGFFEHAESSFFNIFIADEQKVAQKW
jgi:hypothetical protein